MGSASSARVCALLLWVPTVTHRGFSVRVEDIKPLIGMEMVMYLGKKLFLFALRLEAGSWHFLQGTAKYVLDCCCRNRF